ncbi:hypothetical protein niasHT_010095 [Heterodera trifolii]|uniref:Uncharacterized protein n=1 Tax=Heterodera trifolii TaxID=157864 RepID=A0ABD2LWC9_9BILA
MPPHVEETRIAPISDRIEIFVASRFILGFFVTIGIGISSVFLTECSQIQCRGGTGMIIGLIKKAFIIELN